MTEYRDMSYHGPVTVEAVIPESTARDVTYQISCAHGDFGQLGLTSRHEAERIAAAHASQHRD